VERSVLEFDVDSCVVDFFSQSYCGQKVPLEDPVLALDLIELTVAHKGLLRVHTNNFISL
jgi:hypothetical protein